MDEANGLGARIAAARKRAGLSQSAAAKKLRIPQPRIAEWETGVYRPNSKNLANLAELFGLSIDQLVRGPLPWDDTVSVPRGTSESDEASWPRGWRARAYRLQLEAAEAGAPDPLIDEVRRVMLNPGVQALWHGGKVSEELGHRLDGIEIAVRGLLRAGGYMVRELGPGGVIGAAPRVTKPKPR